MKPDAEQHIRDQLADRVSFDPEILSSYGFDLGEMPRMLLSLFKTMPDAVVVPSSASDIAATLLAAKKFRIPVTPRGQATSGYGGAIATRGGIVLDMSRMNRILSVDAKQGTVDVEPGVVWGDLSRHLNRYGLDVRLCPTSGPSSTVGGWYAMGGSGIGSMESGSIEDVVVEIDVAGLDGSIQRLKGEEMRLHHQTCGILGVLTRLRLLCKPLTQMSIYGVVLPNMDGVQDFVITARKRFSANTLMLHSPGYRRLKAEAEGHQTPHNDFLAVVAVPHNLASDADVCNVAGNCNGRMLSQNQADAEWRDRFYPMRIKKLGPSLVVSEFILPDGRLASCWKALEGDLCHDTLALEACVVRGGRIVMLVYMLDDASSLLYPVRMAKAIRPITIARRHGGAPYATGLWMAFAAAEVLGAKKLAAVRECKRSLDPQNLLNPGKVLGARSSMIPFVDASRLLNLGSRLISRLARRLACPRSMRPTGASLPGGRHG